MRDEVLKYTRLKESGQAKNVSIRKRNGFFIVTVPQGFRIDLSEVVDRNFEWFSEMLPSVREFREKMPDRRFEEGETLSVMEDTKEIKVIRRRSCSIEDDVKLAEHLVQRTSVKDRLENVLKEHARQVFEEKSKKHSQKVKEDFNRIFIRDQDTRWGSCSGKNNLNFNWRLILGPEHIVDYLVIHELVHLEHRNHSEKFWSRVKELMPEYRKSKEWLENNSAKLVFDTSKY